MIEFLAILTYFLIASWVHIVAKRIHVPYTILLFLTGLLLIPLTLYVPGFQILDHFQLTPDLLFFVFLPVLIFESGYNIKHQMLAKNSKTIWTLLEIVIMVMEIQWTIYLDSIGNSLKIYSQGYSIHVFISKEQKKVEKRLSRSHREKKV